MNEDLEKTLRENEELKQRLEEIELAKAKKEQDELKAKVEAQQKIELQKHDEELIAKVKAELGFNAKSRLEDEPEKTAMNMQVDNEHIQFGAAFVKRRQNQGHDMQGLPYEKVIEKMQYKEYATTGGK